MEMVIMEIVKELIESAKDKLNEDGYVLPLAILSTDDGVSSYLFDFSDKVMMELSIKRFKNLCTLKGCEEYYFVSEAVVKQKNKPCQSYDSLVVGHFRKGVMPTFMTCPYKKNRQGVYEFGNLTSVGSGCKMLSSSFDVFNDVYINLIDEEQRSVVDGG